MRSKLKSHFLKMRTISLMILLLIFVCSSRYGDSSSSQTRKSNQIWNFTCWGRTLQTLEAEPGFEVGGAHEQIAQPVAHQTSNLRVSGKIYKCFQHIYISRNLSMLTGFGDRWHIRLWQSSLMVLTYFIDHRITPLSAHFWHALRWNLWSLGV